MDTNTSGQGATATVPAEIQHWNWGAFFLNWIWGIGNNTLIALLMFVPVVNIGMVFVLGAKGSTWAWRNKRWDSVEQFRTVQRSWAKWGLIVWLGMLAFCVAMVVGLSALFKNSEAFLMSMARLSAHQEVVQAIGQPMHAGIPAGSIQVAGPSGSAKLSFGLDGPKGKGTVYVEASRDMGQWKLERLVLQLDESGRRIDVEP